MKTQKIESTLPKEEIIERIISRIDNNHLVLKKGLSSFFMGTIYNDHFSIIRYPEGKGSTDPLIIGNIESQEGIIIINIVFKWPTSIKVFFWFMTAIYSLWIIGIITASIIQNDFSVLLFIPCTLTIFVIIVLAMILQHNTKIKKEMEYFIALIGKK